MAELQILSLIVDVIGIIEFCKKLYDTAESVNSLPDAFEKVAQLLPLVIDTLRKAEEQLDKTKGTRGEEWRKDIEPIINGAKGNAEELRKIFIAAIPTPEASRLERYIAAARALRKKGRVEAQMEELLQKVQQLVNNRGIEAATEAQVEELKNAIRAMSEMTPSISDSEFDGPPDPTYYAKEGDIYAASGNASQRNAGRGSYHEGGTQHYNSGPGGKNSAGQQ